MEIEEALVNVRGRRVRYLHAGLGRPMLLIHGLVGSASNWRRNIVALAQNASVYAVNLARADEHDRIADLDVSLAAIADRIAATIEALGLNHADIVGHSHGGAVALMLAARRPELIRRLILFAPANPFCDLPDPMIRLYCSRPGKLLAQCAPYLPRPVQLIALGRMYGDTARIAEGCMNGYIDELRKPGAIDRILAIVRCWFADMAVLETALPLVAKVPTLLIWGDRDRAMSVASGLRLQRQMTTCELAVIPGSGHVVFEEMPEESNRIMLEWLGRDQTSAQQYANDLSGASKFARDVCRSESPILSVSTHPRA